MERNFRPSTAKKIESAIDILEEVVNAEYERGKADAMMECGKAGRLQGEWAPFSSEEWISPISDFYKCSICCKKVNLFQMRNYNYCPNCGAKMKGADNE